MSRTEKGSAWYRGLVGIGASRDGTFAKAFTLEEERHVCKENGSYDGALPRVK